MSEQINYNTLDVASNVDDLYKKQVLNNLSKFIDDRYAFPSSVNFAAGTIGTANSVSPSLTFPLTATAASALSATGTALTRSLTQTTSGAGAGITANNTQTQSYAVSPQSDANTLRNFQVLYRHAVHGCKIETDYRIPNILLSGRFLPDPFFLQLPHCVLCAAPSKQGRFIDDLGSYRPRVNSELTPAAWLYWRNDVGVSSQEKPPSDESFVDLGHYGRHELFMTKRDFDEGVLTKFVFFFLPNSQPNEVFNQKADISLPEPRQDENPPKDVKNRPQLQSITPSASSHVTPSAPYIVTPSAPATNQRFTPTSQAPLIPFVITPPFQ